ncbi:hypothetical protein GUJ93_ZPchr0012g21989 [Zizania palustris]|uniref:Uncharacterized protein n=1 Tax=Zizania palustris TaxID=103762 RepID=A0A8J5WRW5_ZIZPA|nr:hypothetical protein GUJ93_ZPchr0012g21989 [Zizania palustris]
MPPNVMRRLDLLAAVILAALAAGGGGSVTAAVAAGKYDATASRPWGSYSYGRDAHAAAKVVATLQAVEDVVAPEFFPVELVGGGKNDYISFPSIYDGSTPACSPHCANPPGKGGYISRCIYYNHCSSNQ